MSNAGAGFVLFVIFVLISGITGLISHRLVNEDITVEINNTYIKRYGDQDIFHVVVVKSNGEREILQNKDCFWWWKYNSADIQDQLALAKNKQCRLTVTGWRWGYMNWFRNIAKYEVLPS
ncbi:MAG TPA: DUF1523 family protein [Candidatus Paceibacterota bacterium]|nr:DUF1523 family protein [Candidatus Pacearchaeota archaeon]HRZ50909.1 DUF1523 family protein [Candidatus Paceibacterota bacterium]HSA36630.1 DUF1523 family protein [Candidatus Paceibacterota bacterium]